MDEKISLEAIALYGDAYTEKVLKDYFSSQERITGQEILNLCNIQQINLFVVKELFRAWKEETKKLKSPYFNFENAEVKEALENFMAVLSRNILITQPYFSPLLKRAVSQTLLVIFDPYDFFSMLITGKNNKLEVPAFREEIKYLKVNKAPLERMLQKLEERGVNEISGNEAFAILDQILEEVNFTPEDVETYIEKFSAVVPLDPARFYVLRQEEVKISVPPPPAKQEPVRTEPVAVNKPKVVANSTPSPTVNDKLNRENQGRPTVAQNFQKISRIKDNLTINQKFMFTKVLFHGDFELFSKAVDRIDQMDNLNAALRYIEEEHASTWDRDSEEFHEFMELVEKRFS
jgi:hypothetical protein